MNATKHGRIARLGYGKIGSGIAGVAMAGMLAATGAWAGGTLVYSGTNIVERWQNDGGFNSVQNNRTVTLTGDSFVAGSDFIAGGQVTATNVPYGLTPVALRTAANTVTVSLSGFANTNGPSATTNGLQFVFNNSAFSNGSASSITSASGTNLTVSFLPIASNWYVSASGSEANTGTTIGSPFLSITNAIKHAQANANDVINIAAGTYTITNQPAIAISSSTSSKSLTFAGTNAALTIIQASATPGTATNGIFSYGASGDNAMFLNLTMQNGRAGAGSGGGGGGGAIYAYSYVADLIASNCVFINNSAITANGGAITHAANTSGYYLTLISCIFSNNTATNIASQVGGAIYAADNMTISNCVFVGNGGGTNGGAVSFSTSCALPASIINTLFINNASLTGLGGGGYFGGTGPVGIYGCTFASNSAPLGGGGFYVKGPLAVTNSTCYANTSTIGVGGGIDSGYANFPGLLIYNSTIFGNTASNGGGIYLNYQEGATIYSSIIAGNTASSGPAPDIVPNQATTAQWWATNSLIGATNGIGNGTLVASLTSAAALNMPNASGNYCGSTAAPQLSGLLPLAWNGGLQPTCALQPTSVAIYHGANPMGLPYDERGPGYRRSNALGQTDMGAYDYSANLPSFVYSVNIYQGTTAGTIVTTNTIALVSATGADTFQGTNGTDFVAQGWLLTNNVPAGLSVTAIETSSTNLNVTLTGTASSRATVSNMTFSITSNALITTSAVSNNFAFVFSKVVGNYVTVATNYVVFNTVNNTPALSYSGTTFYESAPLNNGSISNTITITLTNTFFAGNAGDDLVALGKLQVSNLSAGLTAQALLNNPYVFPQTLTVSLSGNATAHNSPNNVTNLTFAFQNSAFQFVPASGVNNATASNLQISYVNPVLAYVSKTFNESWKNDGSIPTTLIATLVGDTFNGVIGENLYASGKVTSQNVPAGLTAAVTIQSATGLVVALTGNASPNTANQNVSNLGLAFSNNAFAVNQANLVTNYNESDLSVIFLSQNPSNWYVSVSGYDTQGTGANQGDGSTGHPWKSITNALAHAQASANDVIHIAAGTYTITNQPAISVSKFVTFLGDNPATTIIQANANPNAATNGLFYYGSACSCFFQNLTLQNGRAAVGGAALGWGSQTTDLIASNCFFLNNAMTATNGGGGAIDHHQNGSANYLTLIGCTFSNNVATNGSAVVGGAVYVNGDILTISNCVFVGNTAPNGGAVYYAGNAGSISLINTLFINNTAAGFGATVGLGGGFNQAAAHPPMGVDRCTFAGNSASGSGGGMCVNCTVSITNSTFYGNTSASGFGGALYNAYNSGNFNIYNATFFGNSAATGGAVYVRSVASFYSSIVASNTATIVGPDIYQNSNAAWATNSLIGITNGAAASGVAMPTLIDAGINTTNASGNFCGNATTPQNPGLLPLAWNGGLQPTCALQPTSVAIHTGANPLGLPYDERGPGYARSNAQGQTDMGAYENGSTPVVPGSAIFFR